jgi:uncharacterized Zn finger protein
MDKFEFLVQGSSVEPYRVIFWRRAGGNFSASCTCAAGESGMSCKHRIRILCGYTEGIVSDNQADVKIVAGWLAGSDIERAMQEVENLEREAARIKKMLSEAKKVLSQTFLVR